MRKALLSLTLLLLGLSPAVANADPGLVLSPPVPGALLRPFDGGTSLYSAGHRGVDLAADEGAEVRAAAVGKVYFAGQVAGRPSVSVDHGNGLRTTYTPVAGSVSEGAEVQAGQVIGHLAGPPHCDPRYCLHWGLTDGTNYYDPMLYLRTPPIRLLPHGTTPSPGTAPRTGSGSRVATGRGARHQPFRDAGASGHRRSEAPRWHRHRSSMRHPDPPALGWDGGLRRI